MLLFLSLLTPPAHAVAPSADAKRAIRVIQAAPTAVVTPPQPTEVIVDMTVNPPVTKTVMISGRGIGIANCPGHENAVIAYFSDPTDETHVLSVMTKIDGRYTTLADSDLDGRPELAIVEDGANPTLKTLGKDEFTAFTLVMLCAGVLETR